MATRSIALTAHFDDFIQKGIEGGRFSDATEAIEAGLSLLEQHQEEYNRRLEWLRTATQDALDQVDRGEGIRVQPEKIDEFISDCLEQARVESAEQATAVG